MSNTFFSNCLCGVRCGGVYAPSTITQETTREQGIQQLCTCQRHFEYVTEQKTRQKGISCCHLMLSCCPKVRLAMLKPFPTFRYLSNLLLIASIETQRLSFPFLTPGPISFRINGFSPFPLSSLRGIFSSLACRLQLAPGDSTQVLITEFATQDKNSIGSGCTHGRKKLDYVILLHVSP